MLKNHHGESNEKFQKQLKFPKLHLITVKEKKFYLLFINHNPRQKLESLHSPLIYSYLRRVEQKIDRIKDLKDFDTFASNVPECIGEST